MLKKWAVRSIAMVLILCMLLPMTAFAANEEKVRYSDLFYGYSTEYLISRQLQNYAIRTTNMMDTVCNAYMDSPKFILTGMDAIINAYTHPQDLYTLLADTFTDSSYTYENAIDSANKKVFLHLLSSYGTVREDGAERLGEITGMIEDLAQANESFEAMYDWSAMDTVELADTYLSFLLDYNLFLTIPAPFILSIGAEAAAIAKGGVTAMELLNGIALALLMEDVRLSMIDDVLTYAGEDSMIGEGFSRLRSQLQYGFVGYFIANYLVDTAVDHITDLWTGYVMKKVTPIGLTAALIRISREVVLDMILAVPSIDEVLEQIILKQYAVEMYQVVIGKTTAFRSPFKTQAVMDYSHLVGGLIAATNAALDATEPLTLDENANDLAAVQASWGEFTYFDYICGVMDTISDIPTGERIIKTYTSSWRMEDGAKLHTPSDRLEPNTVYLFRGALRADAEIHDGMTLATEDGSPASILGSLRIVGGNGIVTVPEGQVCTVRDEIDVEQGGKLLNLGKLECHALILDPVYNQHSMVQNSGHLTVETDITMTTFHSTAMGDHHGVLMQDDPDALLEIGGSFRAEQADSSAITDGHVVFSGTSDHPVQHLVCHDLTVESCTAFSLLSDLTLTGRMDGGNVPFSHQGYEIKMGSGSFLVPQAASYGKVRIDGEVELGSVTLEQLTVGGALTFADGAEVMVDGAVKIIGRMTIPNGVTVTVGDLDIYHGGVLENHGELACENASVRTTSGSSFLYNHGALTVHDHLDVTAKSNFVMGNTYSYVVQTEERASLYIGKKLTANDLTCLKLTGGTVTHPPAQEVEDLIASIGEVTLEDGGRIGKAEVLYRQLSPAQQSLVGNSALLPTARSQWNGLRQKIDGLEVETRSADGQLQVNICNRQQAQAPAFTAVVCIYDADGRLDSCVLLPVELQTDGQIGQTLPVKDGQTWQVYFVTNGNWFPLK